MTRARRTDARLPGIAASASDEAWAVDQTTLETTRAAMARTAHPMGMTTALLPALAGLASRPALTVLCLLVASLGA
jgi:hypothetical protein